MPVFEHRDYDAHEQVVFINNKKAALRAIIAIHNTNRGPSLGGCRIKQYESEDAALADVLRLSRGMTYKAAIVDIELGGGKSVILHDGKPFDRKQLFEAMAEAVDKLNGAYIISNDLGTTVHDVVTMKGRTEHARGLPSSDGEQHPATAYGVYQGLKATSRSIFGSASLNNIHIAIQGIGTVGKRVARYALAEGARLSIADSSVAQMADLSAQDRVTVVDPNDILAIECDILAPCAIGAVLNEDTIPLIKAKAICGAANNQLLRSHHGDMLHKRRIAYAPDYVVNAGGLIEVWKEGAWTSSEELLKACERIYDVIIGIFDESKSEDMPSYIVANRVAEAKFRRIS